MKRLNILLLVLILLGLQPWYAFSGYEQSSKCGECHSDIYKKWKNSLHANAVSDPVFIASYQDAYLISKGDAKYVCLKCHAPTVLATGDYDLELEMTKEGVTCDFCHTLTGVDLDAENPFINEPGPNKTGPLTIPPEPDVHGFEYSELHLSSKLCASCHEYVVNGVAVMETYSEWKNSPYPAEKTGCQSCHMPVVEGLVSNSSSTRKVNEHNLQGGHYIEQLQKSVRLSVKSIERTGVRVKVLIEVENSGSGHRLPTGIPTRKLILKCDIFSGKKRVSSEKMVFEKIIINKQGVELKKDSEIMLGYGAEIIKDNRIFPKERRLVEFFFMIPETQDFSVSAKLVYSYIPATIQASEMVFELGNIKQQYRP